MSNAAQVTSEAVSAWEAGANLAPVFASAVWAYIGGLFDAPDLTHLVVTEPDEHGPLRLRGLLSAARVRRLLAR